MDPLFGSTEVRAKLFVQFELNTTIFLVNLIHPKLIGRHVAKSIAECYDTLQQLLTATLQKPLSGHIISTTYYRRVPS